MMARSRLAAGLAALAVLLGFSPFWLQVWIHGNTDRYLWIIRQHFPCSHMGSGPFQLWVLMVLPWFLSMVLAAAALLVGGRAARQTGALGRGLFLGFGLTGITGALMLVAPG